MTTNEILLNFSSGSIDDMGYIRRSVPDIVDDMALHKDFTLMTLP
jgi:hypothetical protein